MTSEDVLKTLKTIRSKYSSRVLPEWFDTATDKDKQEYEIVRDERYAALDFAINLVKSYRALETAKTQIQDTLNMIDNGVHNE